MGQSLVLGLAEFRTLYSVKSWLSSWLLRMLAQVAFFASIGLLVRSHESVTYLLVGNAVVLVCLESTVVVLFMAGERYQGTLSALLATPGQPVVAFLGRGLSWVVTGLVTSVVTLSLLPPVFGIALSIPRLLVCVPIIAVIGLSSYAYGSFLGGLTLRFPPLDWLVLNVGYLLVMAFAGVNVPVSYWPLVPRALAQILPVTHGLHAVRGVLDAAPVGSVLADLGLEIVVGLGWLTAAAVSYRLVVNHARRRGSYAT